MLINKEDVIKLIYAERDKWYGSGQDCMGAESACDSILEELDKIPYSINQVIERFVYCIEMSAAGVNCEPNSAMQQACKILTNTGQFYDLKNLAFTKQKVDTDEKI